MTGISNAGHGDVPRFLAKNGNLADLAETMHLSLQYALYGLISPHGCAALRHQECCRACCAIAARRLRSARGATMFAHGRRA